MARSYRTISQQNHYDLAAQKFGSLDGIYGVLKAVPSTFDINNAFPFDTDLQLDDTENNLGLLFDANNLYFSTDKALGIFDKTFDETFD